MIETTVYLIRHSVRMSKKLIEEYKSDQSDLIKVEKTYEVAVETALGAQIQNIITETENDAKNRVNAIGTTIITDLKAGNNSYIIAGLSESTTIYFSYKTGNYIYTSSATANALSVGTATLAFTQNQIKANITNINLSGQTNKADKDCTLKFTTDQLGTYTITITEGSNTTTTIKEVTTTGEITISKVYKTTTRYTSITVKIEGVNASVTQTFYRN